MATITNIRQAQQIQSLAHQRRAETWLNKNLFQHGNSTEFTQIENYNFITIKVRHRFRICKISTTMYLKHDVNNVQKCEVFYFFKERAKGHFAERPPATQWIRWAANCSPLLHCCFFKFTQCESGDWTSRKFLLGRTERNRVCDLCIFVFTYSRWIWVKWKNPIIKTICMVKRWVSYV